MKLSIVLVAALGFVALSPATRAPVAAALFGDGKTQPKRVVLNTRSKATKSPDKELVPFDHDAHSTKNHSADLKSVIGCAECHHTDQPKSALKGVLKTSERDVILTTAELEKADAKPVKSCAACHAQTDAKPPGWPENPKVTYDDGNEAILNNEEAYHRNCVTCHESVRRAKPYTVAPTKCADCHSGRVPPDAKPGGSSIVAIPLRVNQEGAGVKSYERLLEVRLENAENRFKENLRQLKEIPATTVQGKVIAVYHAHAVRQVVAQTESELLEGLDADEFAAVRDYVSRYYPSVEDLQAVPLPAATPPGGRPSWHRSAIHRLRPSQQEAFAASAVEEVIQGVFALFTKLKKNKKAVNLMVMSTPDGARFRFWAGGGVRREGDTDQSVANLFRGLYTYEIAREGYKPVRLELNLIDERGSTLHCTLSRTSAGSCRLTK